MALRRLHFLRPPPWSPSLILPKCPSHRLPSTTSRRRFSIVRPLCSKSDPTEASSNSPSIVGDPLDFLNESWTQFHATAETKRQLITAGFQLLNQNDDCDLQPGGRYFFTRNMSSLVAFAVGEKYNVGRGFHVIAAHTDIPCLKLKPRTAGSKAGCLMVNVQTYGGGLWHTLFDRDLSVAGRVILKSGDGSHAHKLVK